MTSTPAPIADAIIGHARNADVANRGIVLLDRFFDRCEHGGPYRLAAKDRLRGAEIAITLSRILGPDAVTKIVFVSLRDDPRMKQPWMTSSAFLAQSREPPDADVETRLCDAIRASLGLTFGDAIERRHQDALRQDLGGAVLQSVWESLDEPMSIDLRSRYEDALGVATTAVGWHGIRNCVSYAAAYAVAGDVATLNRFSPALALLAEALPLGEIEGEPGTWLVLTA